MSLEKRFWMKNTIRMMMLAVAGLVLVILFFLNVTLPITVTFLYMLSVLAALLFSRHRLLVWKRNNESTEHPMASVDFDY